MLNKLRLRLTFFNTLVLTVILSIISIFVYVLMYYNLYSDIDETLITSSHQVESYVNFLQDNTKDKEIDLEKKNEYARIIHNMIRNNISYIVWDTEQSMNINSSYIELDDELLKGIRKGVMNQLEENDKIIRDLNREFYFQTISQEGINYRICTVVFSTDLQRNNLRTIQTIKTLKNEKDVLNRLTFTLLSTVIVGITLSFIGGYILAGRSLVPIQKSWKRQEEFVADASHELRTPLAVVQTNLEVVKGSPNELVSSQDYWINNAYDETLRMNKLIEDLLFLARVDSGETLLEQQEVDFTFLLQDVNEKLMPLAAKSQIRIFGDIEENLKILADSNKLRQLMVILIDNAIKYSSPNSMIRIKGKSFKNGVMVEVIDQGIGMKAEEIKRVFDRFYRTDKVRTREQGGTGLGLSIAKWIVDIHRGKIEIESKYQQGTKVSVYLPAE
ncbi:HAMP domain-containing histidine kinase [Irregularibacter muris]|uniref:histidine kinase n=1 Tax=Irregularibacter muris TaxID=1796619 RepID=A0AAE3L3U0_9FIRM|nr:HAMP domain-containing histidine kinase [Irregularibacter muris]MCR1898833.1 HAMP domain-containing histidine kinase [Irregularibacter muris]